MFYKCNFFLWEFSVCFGQQSCRLSPDSIRFPPFSCRIWHLWKLQDRPSMWALFATSFIFFSLHCLESRRSFSLQGNARRTLTNSSQYTLLTLDWTENLSWWEDEIRGEKVSLPKMFFVVFFCLLRQRQSQGVFGFDLGGITMFKTVYMRVFFLHGIVENYVFFMDFWITLP